MFVPYGAFFQFIFASVVQFYGGIEFLRSSILSLKNRLGDMNLLVSIGTLSAYLYSLFVLLIPDVIPEEARHLYFEASASVITFLLIGRYIETKTKLRATQFMVELISLKPKKTTVIVEGKECSVDADSLVEGDVFIVKPGEVIPADGVVLEGSSEIDKSSITGESKPEFVSEGSLVLSGSLNQLGVLKVRALKSTKESIINQVINLLLTAQSKKPKIGRLADRITYYFVPTVLVIAILTFDLWYLLMGSLDYGFVSMVSVLVIACPCALGLATPIAIVSIVGRGAKEGILFRNPEVIETAEDVDLVVFDKTGTITTGKMEVVDSLILDRDLLGTVFSLEKDVNHPISESIYRFGYAYVKGFESFDSKSVIPGEGVVGKLGDRVVFAGNRKMIDKMSVEIQEECEEFFKKHNQLGHTVVFAGINDKIVAMFALSDKIREESFKVIKKLKRRGIKTAILTGDEEKVAKDVAEKVGVDFFYWGLNPVDKYRVILNLKKEGKRVVYVGDGINDAVAMTTSDISIAVSNATELAKNSGDIVLLNSDLKGVIKSLNLSKIGLSVIKQNLLWAYLYNILGIPIAAGLLYPAFGILLNPMYGAFAMSLSSISVVLNSLRLKKLNIEK